MRVSMSSLNNKTITSCSFSEDDTEQLRRGPWTLEEDTLLVHYIARHGEGRWNLLAKRAGLRRTGKSCRLRWLNYLNPDIKRGNLTPQEQLLILDLHSKWGNRWSKIARHLPGRTDNEIKNYWRTRVQKQARHLKVDANSRAFQDIIRRFWMPRLLQKIEGSSSSSSSSSSSCQTINYAHNNLQLPIPPPPPPPPLPQEISGKGVYDQNSDSNSCISSSSQSIHISQISDYTNSPFHGIGNNGTNNSAFVKDGYYVDSNCYNMESMDLALPGEFYNPARDRHVPQIDWVGYDFGENMWSMDEFMAI